MRFVSLFAGIGGIDLGFERAGLTCVAQVENDPWCVSILEKHWPDVPRWGDIRDLDPKELPDHDVIAGGFPCQPVSLAGSRAGRDDPRWLWPEFFRLVRGVRPRFVVVENVPGLLSAGMGDVLGDLADVGYDAEWASISATSVGAPHRRDRIFIVAYPHDEGQRLRCSESAGWSIFGSSGTGKPGELRRWAPEPGVGRMAHGVPDRLDRLRGLGNAVLPQVAELIGRTLMQAASRMEEAADG
jgi:DNA (cytosine-5)-methyltransferase 1